MLEDSEAVERLKLNPNANANANPKPTSIAIPPSPCFLEVPATLTRTPLCSWYPPNQNINNNIHSHQRVGLGFGHPPGVAGGGGPLNLNGTPPTTPVSTTTPLGTTPVLLSPTALQSLSAINSSSSRFNSATALALNPVPSLRVSTAPGLSSSSATPTSALSPTASRKYTPRQRKGGIMPSRQGSKRPADGVSGNGFSGADDGGQPQGPGSKMKIPRMERGPGDFSTVIKSRLQSYTRTGQACDRCKVRKIRCDALPNGCSPCAGINMDCFVTDRVTGRTEKRGYMDELEKEKEAIEKRMQDLENLLQQMGLEVKPLEAASKTPSPSGADAPATTHSSLSTSNWKQFGSLSVRNCVATLSASNFSTLSNQSRLAMESRPQEHVGVAQDMSPLSSISGTRLSIFGTSIDTTSFSAPDVDEPPAGADASTPLYNKSVQAFLQSSMRVNPAVHVELPTRKEAFTYVDWYFLTVATFVPILHKPSFLKLMRNIYDVKGFEPSIADQVIVHMVFATIFFQYAVRNWQEPEKRTQFNDRSNKHYHFALSKIYDLLSTHDFASVQAMVMIASHTRAFPKPGCGAIIANMALQQAIDLNLHRNPKKPVGGGTNLQNEMHKRVWWVALMVVVAITGRRGVPLPITVDEFDTEYPESVADELLTEEGIDHSRKLPCSFEPGLAGIKITTIYMQMYSNIYSVRRSAANYINIVNSLESQIEDWRSGLPESLNVPESGQIDNHTIAAFYVQTFELELRLCIRHPSVAMTANKQMMIENSSICEETAKKFLNVIQAIVKMNSLDTTWYQTSVYTACIFSMLVSSWERRFETTPAQLNQLREDMRSWMNVLDETSHLLGSGNSVQTQIQQIIDQTVSCIDRDMRSKKPKQTPPEPVQVKQEQAPAQSQYQTAQPAPEAAGGPEQSDGAPKGYFQNHSMNNQPTYPPLTYEDQQQSHAAPTTYQQDTTMYFNTPQHGGVAAPPTTNPISGFPAQALAQHVQTPTPNELLWDGRTAWDDWTASMGIPQNNQERFGANTLMTLGNGGPRNSIPSQGMTDHGVSQPTGDLGLVPHGTQWPMMFVEHRTQSGP